MGSCRGPAAYSNTYGFRPTPGLIASSRVGHNSKLPLLTTPGCFSKNPEDNINTVTKIAVAFVAPKKKPKPLSKKLNPMALRSLESIEPANLTRENKIIKTTINEAIDLT